MFEFPAETHLLAWIRFTKQFTCLSIPSRTFFTLLLSGSVTWRSRPSNSNNCKKVKHRMKISHFQDKENLNFKVFDQDEVVSVSQLVSQWWWATQGLWLWHFSDLLQLTHALAPAFVGIHAMKDYRHGQGIGLPAAKSTNEARYSMVKCTLSDFTKCVATPACFTWIPFNRHPVIRKLNLLRTSGVYQVSTDILQNVLTAES